MCENPNPQELQEIELTLGQEQLGTEPLTLTSQVVDSEMLDAYNKAKKEKYHKYYLNKKQKKKLTTIDSCTESVAVIKSTRKYALRVILWIIFIFVIWWV